MAMVTAAACESSYNRSLYDSPDLLPWLVDATLSRSRGRTEYFKPAANGHLSGGGLAIVLRGGAFRGAGGNELINEARRSAQIECSASIHRELILPLVGAGIRVHVFVTVYDTDVADPERFSELIMPFASHVAAITTLNTSSGKYAEQLTSAVHAIDAMSTFCAARGEAYDSVLLTRYDMRFKLSALRLLGVESSPSGSRIRMDGIRFLWHEIGPAWRFIWSPSPREVAKATPAKLDEWQKVFSRMTIARDRMFRSEWKRIDRTADTMHAFGFGFTRCFRAAIVHEMARGWKTARELDLFERTVHRVPRLPPAITHSSSSSPRSALNATSTRTNASSNVAKFTLSWPSKAAITMDDLSAAQRAWLLDRFPTNHWLHKMKQHVVTIGACALCSHLIHRSAPLCPLQVVTTCSFTNPHKYLTNYSSSPPPYTCGRVFIWGQRTDTGLRVDTSTAEWSQNGTALPLLGYLLPDGAFSSNPCGAACLLNPVYEFLPRQAWVVASGLCQRFEDFVWDPTSRTLCCPSPDYCCPHSATNCSARQGVTLFDMSTANRGGAVPTSLLMSTSDDGWRRHFTNAERRQGLSTLCHAARGQWNGGASHPNCFWAMDDASTDRLREAWTRAEATAPMDSRTLHDDDDTHLWHMRGGPQVH